MYRRTRGLTLIGFLITLAVLVFFAYMAMRLVPMYMEYFSVAKALEQEGQQLVGSSKGMSDIRNDMAAKFDTQYVDTSNVPLSAITVEHENGARVLHVHYERRAPFLYNVDFVATFDKSVRFATDTGDN